MVNMMIVRAVRHAVADTEAGGGLVTLVGVEEGKVERSTLVHD